MNARLHLLVCQYYLREAQAILRGEGFEDVTVSEYPDVCVHPQADRMAVVDRVLAEAASEGRTVILVGACFMLRGAHRFQPESSAFRVHRESLCFNMLVNKTLIDGLLRDGAYLVTPGWLEQWEHQVDQWQFDQATARAFFAESATKLVLLDTGVDPAVGANLRNCAGFFGLPAETVPVGLDHFRAVLSRIVQDWKVEQARLDAATVTERVNRKLADHMMALDLLVQLTRIMTEEEAVRVIMDLFAMLFGAGRVLYAPVSDEVLGPVRALNPAADDDDRIRWWFERLKAGEGFVAADHGFCIRISHQQKLLGVLGVDPVEFPQHRQDYLNLALNVAPLCGLTISNAQTVSERQRMAAELSRKSEELARSNADLEQFAYVASHDLQAPLRRIIEFGNMLNEDCGAMLNDTGRQCVEQMQRASARMQQLIKGLLTYSRVGRSGTAFAPVRLNAVLQLVAEDLAPRLRETGGTLDVGDLPEVMADPTQMYQLFQNLCGNALKFIAKGTVPRVQVSCRHIEGGRVEIAVKDNGIGFDEKFLEKIFKPFQRLHGEEVYPGSGIGLAVCQKLVQRHNGTITAHSRPGEGATFVVTLPEKA